jgi:hypothetical protein
LTSLTVSGDLTVDTTTLKVDSTNNRVGIGTASPIATLNVAGATTGSVIVTRSSNGTTASPVETQIIGSTFTNGTFEAGVYALNSFTNTSANWLAFKTTDTGNTTATRMTIDSSGNLGIGVTPSAWTVFKVLQNQRSAFASYSDGSPNAATVVTTNAFYDGSWKYIDNIGAARYEQGTSGGGTHAWSVAASGTAGNNITFTQTMTLSASNRGILTVGPSGEVASIGTDFATVGVWHTAGGGYRIYRGTGAGTPTALFYASSTSAVLGTQEATPIVFETNNAERARITSGGDFLVKMTATSDSSTGAYIAASGQGYYGVESGTPLICNRKTNDGTLVAFYQDSATEGTISVSGNTVSYNAFAGSHWSQLEDGSKPEILRGTVMEALNELCEWPNESNERLPKAKVSDTAGSKKVYGVFMGWDNDWTATNDMYVTSLGAFICRVAADVVVEQGDLLESNGDGTARVQADDVIRSSTIGKVTSTVKTHEYEDGTYCVPTVLYCG